MVCKPAVRKERVKGKRGGLSKFSNFEAQIRTVRKKSDSERGVLSGLVALKRRSTSRRTAGQVAEETARQPSSKPSYSRGIPFVGDQFRLLATRTFSYMKSQ